MYSLYIIQDAEPSSQVPHTNLHSIETLVQGAHVSRANNGAGMSGSHVEVETIVPLHLSSHYLLWIQRFCAIRYRCSVKVIF